MKKSHLAAALVVSTNHFSSPLSAWFWRMSFTRAHPGWQARTVKAGGRGLTYGGARGWPAGALPRRHFPPPDGALLP